MRIPYNPDRIDKLQQIRTLLIQADVYVANELSYEKQASYNESECAVWRLCDALGLLAELHPKAVGIKDFTGAGNKIIKKVAQ